MKIGIALDNFTVPGSAVDVQSIEKKAKLADSLGFESLWFWDHLLLGSKKVYPILEPLTLISNISASTKGIRLGALYLFALRDPLVLSKLISTVNHITNERLILGAVAGWYRKEFDAVGIDFEKRGKRLSDNVKVVKSLLYGQDFNCKCNGRTYSHVTIEPRPSKSIPILFGGYLESALKRAATLSDGWISYYFGPEDFIWGLKVMKKYNESANALDNTAMVPIYIGDKEKVIKFTQEYTDLPPWSRCSVESGVWGSVNDIINKAIKYSNSGVKRLIFIPAYYEIEQIELLGEKVIPEIQERAG